MADLEKAGAQTCFVDMPFGRKLEPKSGVEINFDQVFETGIRPGVEAAGLQCVRGDQEQTGGIIHEAMFARLLLSEFVIADLTTANANVFYELGVRHAARPYTTIPIFAALGALPFDVNMVRAIPYTLEDGELDETDASALSDAIEARIHTALDAPTSDSPIYQLFQDYPRIELSHEMTDVFDDRIRVSEAFQRKLDVALNSEPKEAALDRLRQLQAGLGNLRGRERGLLMKLYLAYRDLNGHQEMVELYDDFPGELKQSAVAQQQLAFALNRRRGPGDREEAMRILQKLLKEHGEDAETYGLLGRIHKDRYLEAKHSEQVTAAAILDEAIEAYTQGFESEPADYFPGVNALTLLTVKDTPEARAEFDRILPLVAFAVARRGGSGSKDYWDVATVLELAVLGKEYGEAGALLPRVLNAAKAGWMLDTTANNLELLLEAQSPDDSGQLAQVIDTLRTHAQALLAGAT